MTKFAIPPNVGFWDTDFRQYTGAFGWHEVKLAEWVYVSAAVVVVALVAGAARAVAITGALRRHGLVIAFFALVALSLFFSLHWTEYTMIKESGTPFLQGRYFVRSTRSSRSWRGRRWGPDSPAGRASRRRPPVPSWRCWSC